MDIDVFGFHEKAESCIDAMKTFSFKLALDLRWCGTRYFYIQPFKCNMVNLDVSSFLFFCSRHSRSCWGNSAVASRFRIISLSCVAAWQMWLWGYVKTSAVRVFKAEIHWNMQLHIGQLTALENARALFLCGMWAMESAYVCIVWPNNDFMQVVTASVSGSSSRSSPKNRALACASYVCKVLIEINHPQSFTCFFLIFEVCWGNELSRRSPVNTKGGFSESG